MHCQLSGLQGRTGQICGRHPAKAHAAYKDSALLLSVLKETGGSDE